MDTTAAAELGTGVVDGPGYWDSGVGEVDAWGEKIVDQGGWVDSGGAWSAQNSGASDAEPPLKRMRNMSGDGGSYGSGSGYGSGYNPGQNAGYGGSGGMEMSSRGGYGQAQIGSPGMRSQFSSGNGGYGSGGVGPAPGTPNGDSGSGQGMGRGRGSIFYKTKLCSRFRNGNCPYSTNCNFAHGMEELRKPPPGWEDNGQDGSLTPNQSGGQSMNPSGGGGGAGGGGSSADMQRFHKTRPCKKYFSEMGCPYGDRCNFLHDEPSGPPQPKPARETASLNAGTGGAVSAPSNGLSSVGNGAVGGPGVAAGGINQRPPNWKTRLCNKWEITGNCPFGEKCHFAHGAGELQRYGGGPVDSSTPDGGSMLQNDSKYGGSFSATHFSDADDTFISSSEGYAQGASLRQPNNLAAHHVARPSNGPANGTKPVLNWKIPVDGISTIYGDWIEEEEWENPRQVPNNSQLYGLPQSQQRAMEDYSADTTAPKLKGTPAQQNVPAVKFNGAHESPAQRAGPMQGNGYPNSARNGGVVAQSTQGTDVGYGAQEPGYDSKYRGAQGWGGEL